jgi:tryptophan synthase alpha chain
MAGEPSKAAALEYARAVLLEADILEIGVPFSDPVADGPTIERAHTRGLQQGTTLNDAFALARALRAESDKPLVMMTYYNPVLRRGLSKFAQQAKDAGLDGVILPDCPLDECGDVGRVLADAGIDLVQIASPATPAARFGVLAKATRGFLYVISAYGVTGARDALSPEALNIVKLARESCGDAPFAVGFGVSTADQIETLHRAGAPGVVVGSAIVARIEKAETPDQLRSFVAGLRARA